MNLQICCKNTIYFSDSQGKWGIIWKNKWKLARKRKVYDSPDVISFFNEKNLEIIVFLYIFVAAKY